MRRLLRFVFGAALGASVAMLATPKTGRELREQLLGPDVRKLMPARLAELIAPPEAPPGWPEERVSEPAEERAYVAPVVTQAPPVEEPELAAWSGDAAETAVEEAPVEVAETEGPAVFEEDLRVRMDETKAAIVSEIDRPFEAAPGAVAAGVVAEEALAEAETAEAVAEEAVVEAAVAEEIAEEAVAEAVVTEEVAEEAVVEAAVAEEVA
jgi:transcription termination factor Rho